MVVENDTIVISVNEYNKYNRKMDARIEELKVANAMLRKAVLQLTSKVSTPDVVVSRKDFVEMYNDAVTDMLNKATDESNDIYGYEVTVHWHGICCDCGDGAEVSNYIIPAIIGLDGEM